MCIVHVARAALKPFCFTAVQVFQGTEQPCHGQDVVWTPDVCMCFSGTLCVVWTSDMCMCFTFSGALCVVWTPDVCVSVEHYVWFGLLMFACVSLSVERYNDDVVLTPTLCMCFSGAL